MKVPVQTLSAVMADGDQWATRTWDLEGSITVPDHAISGLVDNLWALSWVEVHYLLDRRCPVCMSSATCLQRVEVFPDSGHVLVVHGEGPEA